MTAEFVMDYGRTGVELIEHTFYQKGHALVAGVGIEIHQNVAGQCTGGNIQDVSL